MIKLECLNKMNDVIGNFLNIENFILEKFNNGIDKYSVYAYDEFKKLVKIPKEYADIYYKDNIYMNHFYTETEKSEFLLKWKDNII